MSGSNGSRLCENRITASYKLILKESILAILQISSTMGILGRFWPGSDGIDRFHTASVGIGHSRCSWMISIDRLGRGVKDMNARCRRLRNGASVSSSTTIEPPWNWR